VLARIRAKSPVCPATNPGQPMTDQDHEPSAALAGRLSYSRKAIRRCFGRLGFKVSGPQFGVEYHIQRRAAAWLIARFIISPMRNRTRESSISSLYPTTRDVNRFSSMLVSILFLLGFAEKSRSVLSGRHAFLGIWDHRHVSSV
jgi:hypothetical protein